MGDISTPPPELAGFASVRSVEFERNCSYVASFFGKKKTNLVKIGNPTEHILALQPIDQSSCNAHLLTKIDLKEASEWLEETRLLIEDLDNG